MQYRFSTIGQYVEWKRKRRSSLENIISVVILAIFVVPPGFLLIERLKTASHGVVSLPLPPGFVADGSMVPYVLVNGLWVRSLPVKDGRGTGLSLAEADRALDIAVAAWRVALHDPSIAKPKLVLGYCSDEYAIACVHGRRNEIEFSGRLKGLDGRACDLPTVFMHEMGHILGVPHIEGDPLMDPICQKGLTAPSQDAIAIAKVHRKETVR